MEAIFSVVHHKGSLLLGKKSENVYLPLISLTKDANHFKNCIENKKVIMGKHTYSALVEHLDSYTNTFYVITSENSKESPRKNIHFISKSKMLKKVSKEMPKDFIVIGGPKTLLLFSHLIEKVFVTEILKGFDIPSLENYITLPVSFLGNYKLIGFSKKHKESSILANTPDGKVSFRFLIYKRVSFGNSQDNQFKYLAKDILNNGIVHPNRTGINTKSLFGKSLTFDVSNYTLPLTTLRPVPFRMVAEELLWMLSGSTNSKELEEKGINIWKGNTSSEFMEKNNKDLPEGEIGPGYGFQFRNFGGTYTDKSVVRNGVDQIQRIDELLGDPSGLFSRRLVISLWNPRDVDQAVLPPCHFVFMMNPVKIGNEIFLDGTLIMRSSDELARSWNCAFYTLLLFIFCKRHGYSPRNFTIFMNDCHIYENHESKTRYYTDKEPSCFPKIVVSDLVKDLDFDEMKFHTTELFELIGYFPHSFVLMEMAV